MENSYIIHNGELYHWGKKGMKWGVRRYQNPDGTLTEAGKKRYAKEYKKLSKKKRADYEPDIDEWTTRDSQEAQKILNSGSTLTGNIRNLNNSIAKNAPKRRMNLDEMSDKEMREAINRELLERQYNDLFAEPTRAEKGRARADRILETTGNVLTIGATSLAIATGIRKLMGG
jgi:hypothetical protein